MTSIRSLHLSAWVALGLVGLTGCTEDAVASAEEQNFSEFRCTSPEAEPGAPKIYFAPFDEPERQAICLLDRAREEVLVAHYNIRTPSYLEKLVELHRRGVVVRVAVDEKNAANEWNVGDDFMEEIGIDLLRTSSTRGGLMHLKVTVIDGTYLMTGSFNWNETAQLANDENMLVLREPSMVEVYRNHTLDILDRAPDRLEPVTDEGIDVLFVPEQAADGALIDRIQSAQSSIDVAMFTFTSRPVADALSAAARRGVRLRAVLERKQLGTGRLASQLETAGGQVIRAANRIGQFSAMHQKYAIIDDAIVITGATNWTHAGTRTNDEDLVVIDRVGVAEAYRKNFADLLHVYTRFDDPAAPPSERSGVLFNAVNEGTFLGDRMVVAGSHPALGSWDPHRGAELRTSETLFPSWTASAKLPAGASVEYKFVVIRSSGRVEWEPGPNRTLTLPASGRSVVVTGPYGDTGSSWVPADN